MKNIHRRLDIKFCERFLDDIKIQRIKLGKDRKMQTDTRISEALRRHPLIIKIKDDIIKADLKRSEIP